MSEDVSLAEIGRRLDEANTVAVASHLRPDGDALGSTIALALWLQARGKTVVAYNNDGMPGKYAFLPHSEIVQRPDPESDRRKVDVFVALDTSGKSRLGAVWDVISEPVTVINIDHHISNERFGDFNFVDATSPATGQIVFEFIQEMGGGITQEIAENLFVAISTDTGSFQYTNTTARTFEVGAELVKAGVKVGQLSQAIYDRQPKRRFELLRLALNSARFSCDDRVASFTLRKDDVDRLGLVPEDNEGIIDHLRSVDGVVAAVFFEDMGDGNVRLSARSKDSQVVDVCDVCGQFGGGGHALAAGARVKGDLAAIEEKFLSALCNEIRRAD